MRKTCIVIIGLWLLITAGLVAQTPRTVKGVAKIESYRPIGERRLWTFTSRDTLLGRLVSGVDSRSSIDGESALIIKGGLRIDFRKIGGEQEQIVQTEYCVSEAGRFLADKLTFQIQERQEEYNFERSGVDLEGYFTRNGEKVGQTVPWPRQYHGLDANFMDQLEMYLATRDLTEGERIDDTVFVPQLLSTAAVSAEIGKVEYRELWKGKFDSIITVNFAEPQSLVAFITLDHRLMRVDFSGMNVRAYLDLVQKVPPKGSGSEATNLVTYVSLGTHYLAYVVIAGLVMLFLAARAFTWKDAYFGLVFGAIVFGLALVTQYPAQKYLVANILLPEIRQGGSLYLWGLLPALAGGVIQELLKLLGIYALMFHREPAINRWAKLGVFVAAGFAIFEACKVTEPTLLISWQLFERSMRLIFHAASGALLAIALASDSARRYLIIAALIALDTFLIYLPVFIQEKAATLQAMHFVLAAVAIGVVLFSLVASSKIKLHAPVHPEKTASGQNGV